MMAVGRCLWDCAMALRHGRFVVRRMRLLAVLWPYVQSAVIPESSATQMRRLCALVREGQSHSVRARPRGM